MMPTNRGSGNVLFKIIVLLSVMVVASVGALGFVFLSFPGVQGNVQPVDVIASEDDDNTEALKVSLEVETIYDNIFIDGIAVGGLTKSEAIKELNSKIQEPSDEKNIEIKYVDKTYDYTFKDFYAKYDIEKKVDEAYSYGRSGTLHERNAEVMKLKTSPLKLELDFSFDDERIISSLTALAEDIYVEAKEPRMMYKDGTFEVTEGIKGVKLDIEAVDGKVRELLKAKTDGTIDVNVIPIEPRFKVSDMDKAQMLIGTFQTTFNSSQKGRTTNIDTASSYINNVMLVPDEVFSTNFHFKETTYENGYRMAPVIKSGKLVDDFGGGVCQVSSTLYNAVLLAELDIVERVNHSLKVGYTDYGFDATLAGDYIDFKFKNSTDYPILIVSFLKGNKLTVNIYGNEIHSKDRKIVLRNQFVQENPPQEEILREDPSLPLGQRVVDVEAKSGFKYAVYKDIYEGQKLLDTVLINNSTYKSVRGEARIGTGEPAPEPVWELPAYTSTPTPTPEPLPVQNESIQTTSTGNDIQDNIQDNVVEDVVDVVDVVDIVDVVDEADSADIVETIEPLPVMPDA